MSKKEIYNLTKKIIEENYKDRFKLNRKNQDIYLDDNIFDLARFRKEVLEKENEFLSDDQYIYELAYLEAEKNQFSPIEDYLNKVSGNYKRDVQLKIEKRFHLCKL